MLKRMLFPIGAGDDVLSRVRGALLVAKWFNTHIDVLTCQLDPSIAYNLKMTLRGGVLFEEFLKSAKAELALEQEKYNGYFKQICNELGIEVSDEIVSGKTTASFIVRDGKRSEVVARESKFYDMIVAAVPLNGKITGTFEAAVINSGKNVIVIPRSLKTFNPEKILVSWTGTALNSRALTSSLGLLKQAKKVHCITSKANLGDDVEANKEGLRRYLEIHGIEATFETVDTSVPGVALLKSANDGNFDLIVAGRYGANGIREIVLGGTSKFFLENTTIPVFL